ncbi:hypothetical protein FQA47_018777 [Oryzias melastigma]|uniref:Uncharacterized protein n=1 Tax=Oryzias melastigma TaxID=30732 RepID=A0A834CBF9_ORYME|nr:hypothetical protein FQA47_018777 [Oryzias melastigma]
MLEAVRGVGRAGRAQRCRGPPSSTSAMTQHRWPSSPSKGLQTLTCKKQTGEAYSESQRFLAMQVYDAEEQLQFNLRGQSNQTNEQPCSQPSECGMKSCLALSTLISRPVEEQGLIVQVGRGHFVMFLVTYQ